MLSRGLVTEGRVETMMSETASGRGYSQNWAMPFRSHVGRPFDLTLWSNRLLFTLVAGFGVAAVVTWANGAAIDLLWAPAHVFVTWALVRELDPDHNLSALLSGVVAGVWVLLGFPVVSAVAVGGFLLAARLVLNSTGRRPLVTDLVFVGGYAAAFSLTRVGWVAGSGLAIAIYVDGRMAGATDTAWMFTAGLAALGASLVATAAGAFPTEVPDVQPFRVTLIGLVALIGILRAPPDPTSRVDSRLKWRLSRDRLHAARSLIGVLVFASALLSGGDVDGLMPLVAALIISFLAAEVEQLRRRR